MGQVKSTVSPATSSNILGDGLLKADSISKEAARKATADRSLFW